jgi:hypothetical protein
MHLKITAIIPLLQVVVAFQAQVYKPRVPTFLRSTPVDNSFVTTSQREQPWWKTVELPHAYIAEKVRHDFPILDTKFKDKPLVYRTRLQRPRNQDTFLTHSTTTMKNLIRMCTEERTAYHETLPLLRSSPR